MSTGCGTKPERKCKDGCPACSTLVPFKRFWVFAGADYEPAGGIRDLESTHETAGAAAQHVFDHVQGKHDWWHIIDSKDGSQVYITVSVRPAYEPAQKA